MFVSLDLYRRLYTEVNQPESRTDLYRLINNGRYVIFFIAKIANHVQFPFIHYNKHNVN